MEVIQAIQTRRAFRSLDPSPVTPELIEDLGRAASLSASCFNNQPWRFIFVHGPEALESLKSCLNPGNEWLRRYRHHLRRVTDATSGFALSASPSWMIRDSGSTGPGSIPESWSPISYSKPCAPESVFARCR